MDPPGLDAEHVAAIQAELEAMAVADRFSGVVQAWHGGRPIAQFAVGLAHRGHQVPNTATTRFVVASVTKMVTAATVLSLVRDGLVTLDAPLVELVPPELRPEATPTTVEVRHLLGHTSGMGSYHDNEATDWGSFTGTWDRVPTYRVRGPRDLLPQFRGEPWRFEPGRRWEYADANYVQLGVVIEELTGEPYGHAARRLVLDPLGMDDTAMEELDADPERFAVGYRVSGEEPPWRSNIYSVPAGCTADGGMVTTARDLAVLVAALGTGALLGPELTTAMFERQNPEHPDADYGLGLDLLHRDGRLVRWGHGGLDPGVNCEVEHHVEADTTMIALGNLDRGAGTAADVVAVALGLPSGAPVPQDEPVPHDAPVPAEEDTP